MNKKTPKLGLAKETLRLLEAQDLEGAAKGAATGQLGCITYNRTCGCSQPLTCTSAPVC